MAQGATEGAVPARREAPAHTSPLNRSLPVVSWLELFYDLVMVAATIVFSHQISHHPTWQSALWTAAMFSLIWWVWLMTTLLVNADDHEDTIRRVLLFAQMMVVVLLTIVGGHALDPRGELVAPLFGLLLILVAGLFERTRRTRPDLRAYARRRRTLCATAGVVVAAASLLPVGAQVVGWLVAGLCIVTPVLVGRVDRGDERPALNLRHLVDRLAALTTIVLGEAFVKVALVASTTHLAGINFVVLCLEFVTVFAVWLSYFDDFAPAGMPRGPELQRLWLVAHLPLHLAIIGMAVGIGAFESLRSTSDLTVVDVFLVTLPLALVFLSMALLGATSPRRPRRPLALLRVATAALIGLVGLVVWDIPAITVELAAACYGVVTLAQVAVAHRLRRRTSLTGA